MIQQEIITRVKQNTQAREEQLDRLRRQHQTLIRALVLLMNETAGKSTTLVDWDTVATLMDDAVFFVKNISKGMERLS